MSHHRTLGERLEAAGYKFLSPIELERQDVVGCVERLECCVWHDPRTGRVVLSVQGWGQWPKVTHVELVHLHRREVGPFEDLYQLTADALRLLLRASVAAFRDTE